MVDIILILIGTAAVLLLGVVIGLLLLARRYSKLLWQASEIGSMLLKLGVGHVGLRGKAAFTNKLNPNPTGKKDLYFLRKLILACGAEWAREADGNWYLIEPAGAKKEIAVRELLDCFGGPSFFGPKEPLEQDVYINTLTAVIKLGFGLPVEYLQKATATENGQGQPKTVFSAKTER